MESPDESPRLPHLPFLDGLRAVAALTVLVNHVFQQIYWTQPPQGWFALIAPWLGMGHFSVTLFIMLSGFCLMRPVAHSGNLRGGAVAFYKSRARRILPAYWAAVGVALLLIGTVIGRPQGAMFDLSLSLTPASIVSHLLLIHNLWPAPFFADCGNTSICSVFWSVGLEWQIYFVFPLFVALWKRWGAGVTLAIISLVAFDVWKTTQGQNWGGICWQGLNADYYAYFAFGMLAAMLACSPKRRAVVNRLPWLGLTLGLAAGFVALSCWDFYGGGMLRIKQFDVYCVPLFVALLVAASRPGRLQRALSCRPLTSIGTYSYSIYLLHLPLVALLTNFVVFPHLSHLPRPIAFLLLLALSIPLVLWTASRFARVFEAKKFPGLKSWAAQERIARLRGRGVGGACLHLRPRRRAVFSTAAQDFNPGRGTQD